MKKGIPTITIPVQKVSAWADHGCSSEIIAEKLHMTVEDLNASLDSLAEKNRKSAQRIRQRLTVNDKRPKQSHRATQVAKPTTSTTTPAQTPAPAPTPAPAEPTSKAAPSKKSFSREVEALQHEIQKSENELAMIDQRQLEAKQAIENSKETVLRYQAEFKQLAAELQAKKAAYEEERSKVEKAENALLSCEGRRVEIAKHLSELKAKLAAAARPEIYVCDGEIQCENVDIPENIDTSDWITVFDKLPDELSDNLRKKDAQLLVRLQAIMATIKRGDTQLVFESEMLQAAWEALAAET